VSFTRWGAEDYSGGTGIGPINSGANERRILTVKNLGPNTIWLALGAADAVTYDRDPITNDPLTNCALAAGETVTFGVLPNELYYYGLIGWPGATVLVWEG
jgi:hypothetical protein